MINLLAFMLRHGYLFGLAMIVLFIALSQYHGAFLIGTILGVILVGLRFILSKLNVH